MTETIKASGGPLSPREREQVLAACKSMREEIASIRQQIEDRDAGEDMSEEKLQGVYGRLDAMPDAKVLSILLGLHKVNEANASGRLRNTLRIESHALAVVVDRLIPPEVGEEALALYFDEEESEHFRWHGFLAEHPELAELEASDDA